MEPARPITDNVQVDQRLVEMPLEISEDGTLEFKEAADSAVGRMRGVVDDIVREHEGGRVVVVSHGASIIACLTDAMQLEAGHLPPLPYYTSISIPRRSGGRRTSGSFREVAYTPCPP